MCYFCYSDDNDINGDGIDEQGQGQGQGDMMSQTETQQQQQQQEYDEQGDGEREIEREGGMNEENIEIPPFMPVIDNNTAYDIDTWKVIEPHVEQFLRNRDIHSLTRKDVKTFFKNQFPELASQYKQFKLNLNKFTDYIVAMLTN